MYQCDAFVLGRGFTLPSKLYKLDFDKMQNAHVAITGTSGSGKTTLAKPLIKYYQNRQKVVYVIDPKKDGLKVDGETLFKFTSRNSEYGLPLFEFDTNKENGGPVSEAKEIVRLIKKYFLKSARENQTGVLFQLVSDTYTLKGFDDKDDSTWTQGLDIAIPEEKQQWLSMLPTMQDLYRNLELFTSIYSLGGSSKFLEEHLKCTNYLLKMDEKEDPTSNALEKIAETKNYLVQLYKSHLDFICRHSPTTKQKEISESIEIPDDADFSKINLEFYNDQKVNRVLKSIKMNIKLMANSGIFNGNIPPVTRGINRFDISGLPVDEQCFFTEVLANRIDRGLRFRGEYFHLPERYREKYGKKYDHILLIDEAQLVMPSGAEAENTSVGLNRIAAEGRSRGLGLVVLTQSPTNIPKKMLTNIGTKMILKTESIDEASVAKRLGITKSLLASAYDTFGVCLINIQKNYEAVALPWVQLEANSGS